MSDSAENLLKAKFKTVYTYKDKDYIARQYELDVSFRNGIMWH